MQQYNNIHTHSTQAGTHTHTNIHTPDSGNRNQNYNTETVINRNKIENTIYQMASRVLNYSLLKYDMLIKSTSEWYDKTV